MSLHFNGLTPARVNPAVIHQANRLIRAASGMDEFSARASGIVQALSDASVNMHPNDWDAYREGIVDWGHQAAKGLSSDQRMALGYALAHCGFVSAVARPSDQAVIDDLASGARLAKDPAHRTQGHLTSEVAAQLTRTIADLGRPD